MEFVNEAREEARKNPFVLKVEVFPRNKAEGSEIETIEALKHSAKLAEDLFAILMKGSFGESTMAMAILNEALSNQTPDYMPTFAAAVAVVDSGVQRGIIKSKITPLTDSNFN